jgi:pimeloyl-ACP methyl ester carboxylesterase
VVLIPGLFGSQYSFRNLVPMLNAAGYRTIVVEPLGLGESSRPERADYSLGAQAHRVAWALDTLGITGVLVIAHGLGAAMAYRVAYRRPDLVRGIVALEGGPAEAAVTPTFRRSLHLVPWVKLLGGIHLVRRRTREMLISSSADTTWVDDDVVRGYTAGAARDLDGTLRAYVAMANARERERVASRLADIRCPVRLLVGGAPHSGQVREAYVAALRGALPSFALDSVAGAGHFIYEERPDAVLAAVGRLEADLAASRGNR